MQFRMMQVKLHIVQHEGDMRLEWLDDILAVVRTGSFAHAAHARNLTPSAFSRRIQGIEDHLGVALFDRARKPVQLHPGVADQRDQMERLASDLRQLTGALQRRDSQNRFVLASQHALTAALTPGLVARIHAAHANVYLRLRSANLDACFAMLLSRQADCALVYRVTGSQHTMRTDYLETSVIGADELVPVCAPAAIPMGKALRMIAYPRDVFLGEVIATRILPLLGEREIIPVAETALTLAAQELVLAGLGTAWLPRSLVQAALVNGRVVDLTHQLPTLALDVTAVRLMATRSPQENAVWRVLTEGTPPA